jgi:DNA-binding CsgD family transcriptional regulator/tetratricopeptide (TPR) repeat protein
MRAAGEAERRGALREVRLQAQRTLRNGEELADEERFELLLRLSRAANFASERIEEGMAAAEQAVELGERLGDTARQSEALIRLAWAMWSLDRVVEALAAAERAAELLADGGDPAGLARARSTVVRMEATAFDPAAAIAGGPDALALAAAAGLDDVCIDVEISVALAHGHHGDPHALDLLTAALARARAAGLPIQSVRACVNLMFVASLLRAHDAADRAMAEAREVFGEYDTPIPERAAESFLARSMLDRGSWDEALAAAARADEGWHGELAVARTVVALVAARRGVPGAVEGLAGVQRELVGVAESSRHAMLRLAQVEEAWLRGDLAACREHLAAAWSSPATTRFARPAGELAVWSMRLSRPVPAPPRASAPVLAELSGDWRAAIRLWTQAGAPYEAALAALAGDDRAARDALSALHRLGAGAAARAFLRCRAAAGAAAVRGPRRSTLANPAGLTRREQEVLERVAGGATNAGVAAALHLSERTVAHHVSAILGKLGAPNRLAAVERARSRGLLP